MSNVLELTDLLAFKKADHKSGENPSKLRFTPATVGSLRKNIESGSIAMGVERYNNPPQPEVTVATANVAATPPVIQANGTPVAGTSQSNPSGMAQKLNSFNMDVLKLDNRFGTLGNHFGVNVKGGFIPKALSVPNSYSASYKDIFKNSDVYKAAAQAPAVAQAQDAPVAAASAPVENAQPAEVPAPEVQEQGGNWKLLFEDSENGEKAQNPANGGENKVAKKSLTEEEIKQRRLIAQLGDELKEVRRLKGGNETPDLSEKEGKLLDMLSNASGVQSIAKNVGNVDGNEAFKNYIEDVTGFNGEQEEAVDAPQEEVPVEEAAVPVEEDKFAGMFGKLNDDSPVGDVVEETSEVVEEAPVAEEALQEEVVTEETPVTDTPVEETEEVPVEEAPVAEEAEPSEGKFLGMFGKLSDDGEANEEETPEAALETATEDKEVQPVEDEVVPEEPVETQGKFLGDLADTDDVEADPAQEIPAETQGKFLGDLADTELNVQEVPVGDLIEQDEIEQEKAPETQGKFLGDLADTELNVQEVPVGDLIEQDEAMQDVAPAETQGKFLGDLGNDVVDFQADPNGAVDFQADPNGAVDLTANVPPVETAEPTTGKFLGEFGFTDDGMDDALAQAHANEDAIALNAPVVEDVMPVNTPAMEDVMPQAEITEVQPVPQVVKPESLEDQPPVEIKVDEPRVVIDEPIKIEATVNEELKEQIKKDSEELAKYLFEYNKQIDKLDEESSPLLPLRQLEKENKSKLESDLEHMDFASAVQKQLETAQTDLVSTINDKIQAIQTDLVTTLNKKLEKAQRDAEIANKSKEELEQQLREIILKDASSKQQSKEAATAATVLASAPTNAAMSEFETKAVEKVVEHEVNKQLEDAQALINDAVNRKIKAAQLELSAAVNAQIQNAQLELMGIVKQQIKNAEQKLVAPNEDFQNNLQRELSAAVTNQIQNAQLAFSLAIDKQLEDAQLKLDEVTGANELSGKHVKKSKHSRKQLEEEPVYAEEAVQEEVQPIEYQVPKWTKYEGTYEQPQINLDAIKQDAPEWANDNEVDVEQYEETATPANYDLVANAVEEEKIEEPEEDYKVVIPEEFETPVEEAEVPVEEEAIEEPQDEVVLEPQEEPVDEEVTPEAVEEEPQEEEPLVEEKETLDEEPQEEVVVEKKEEPKKKIKKASFKIEPLVDEEVKEEKVEKEEPQEVEEMKFDDEEMEDVKEEDDFIPYTSDELKYETLKIKNEEYNMVSSSKPLKLLKKYEVNLASHGNGKKVVLEETHDDVEEVTEAKEYVPIVNKTLGYETINSNDRYCNEVKKPKPIKISVTQKKNVAKRLRGSVPDTSLQDKKELLTSLKEELNSEELDFMRYNNSEESRSKAA